MTLPLQILPSTTSHKREPLLPTLEVFARLGMRDLDLNLNHLVEDDTEARASPGSRIGTPAGRGPRIDVAAVQAALTANQQRVWIVSGGWCDFFDPEPEIQRTFSSVARQVDMARAFGVSTVRLFFGRLPYDRYAPEAHATIVSNIQQLGRRYPDMRFVFENHDGASSHPDVCRSILEDIALPNVRLNFDPINFEHRGVDSFGAAARLLPLIAHVHLKGYERGGFCEFGAGEIDLIPVLDTLIGGGYRGAFTVEYEGTFDRTLRLFQGVRNATSAIERLRTLA